MVEIRTWSFEHLPAMVEVINAAYSADGIERVSTIADLEATYANLDNCDPAKDIFAAVAHGRLVGYSRCDWREEPDGGRIYYSVGELHPDWRRQGLGGRLYDLTEQRIRALARGHPTGPKQLGTWCWDSAVGRVALYESRQLERATRDVLMVRPDLEDIPSAQLPHGLEERTPGPEEIRKVWEADVEAFRDHWGFTEPTDADYREFLAFPWRDVSLWKVAWDGDQVAGQVKSFIDHEENAGFDRRRGYTEDISVRRPYRRRGLARALLVQSLHELRARGMEEAALHVHVDNPSGAYRLYESVGFEVRASHSEWRKPLDVVPPRDGTSGGSA